MTEIAPLRLDPTTLLFSISMLGFLAAGLSLGSAKLIGRVPHGLRHWSKAMGAIGLGFLLYFFRGHAPEVLTYTLANLLVIAAAGYVLCAHAEFLGMPVPKATIVGLCAFGFGGALAPKLFGAPHEVAIFSMSCAFSLLFALSAVSIVRDGRWLRLPAAWIAMAGSVVTALAAATRAAYALAGKASSVEFQASTAPQVIALLAGGSACIAASLGFVLMVHERQRLEVLEGARRDGLTGLLTRSALFDAADETPARAADQAVIMADVDHFKAINDVHGHAAGDVVLAHAGKLMRAATRSADLAGRYGGEEFCVVLADCGETEARRFAERLVRTAARQRVRLPGGGEVRFTFSIGYAVRSASLPGGPPEPFQAALERADAALYQAKREGRNRAVAGCGADEPISAVICRGGSADTGVPATPTATGIGFT